LNQGNELVWSHAWNTEENPFSFASNGDSYESLLKILTNTPNESEQVYRSVSSRGIKQYLFREALLRAYSNKCAITSFSIPEALEACHIVPWAQASEQQRMDVRNGLLLNSLHHKLFDRGYLTITTDYKIVFRRTEDQKHEFTDLERSLTFELQGREMNIPRLHKHRPCPEYINFHHQLFEWEI
jgi:putative restriction endonuclease